MIISKKSADEALAELAPYGNDPEVRATDLEALAKNPDRLTELYRAAARATHPDLGGDAARFAVIDRAKHVLLHWLAKLPPEADKPHGGVFECPRCHGARFVMLQKGFKRLRVQCPSCNGNGELYEKEKEGDRL